MKIVKPLTLGLLHRPYRYRGGHHFVVAAFGFFRLGAENSRFLTENLQWPKVLQTLPAGCPLDEVMPKQRGEALLAGQAFAPGGKPVSDMCVRMCVGAIDKSLRVYGEREWRYGLFPRHAISRPQPFVKMPLVYQRAFGGPDHPGNPVGRGHTGAWLGGLGKQQQGAMPNIEYPWAPVDSHVKRHRPAGFGAIDMGWSPRKDKHGTFGKRWLREDAPGLARDVDWSMFNVAPDDQWLDGYWSGGEGYRLEGMHPEKPVIEGALPKAHARAFIVRAGAAAEAAEEVPLRFDTVWFFPEHELGCVLYHGQTGIADSDALDIDAVMVAYEHAGMPKTLAHYREVFRLRLDPREGALHAFNESQLAPERSAEELAARTLRRQQEQAARLAMQQAVLDELSADHWAQCGMEPPPEHEAARAKPLPIEPLSEQDIKDGDFDLSELMQQARALGAEAKREGEARMEELRKQQAELPPAPAVDPATRKAEAFERASAVAADLLADGRTAAPIDPQFAALMTTLDGVKEAVSAEQREELRKTLASLPALRRRGRNAALKPAFPAEPLAPDEAAWLGEQVRQWHLGGAFLAGRDLAGADLRGADFSGADLREVMLEQADLSGAKFIDADLRGAVFAGAILDGADFSGSKLGKANFCKSRGQAIGFAGADLTRARAIDAAWPQADLSGATLDDWIALNIDLTGAALDGAHLLRSMLLEAKAEGSSWKHARIEKMIALKANLAGADFSGATLVKAVLMDAALAASVWHKARLTGIYGGGKADWSEADLTGVRADGCGWHGAAFVGADLADGQFLRCDFGQCDMSGARLENGLFSRSLFMRTVLRKANARHADFFQALCRKADFTCADLRAASLAQAECSGARFEHACLEELRLERHRSLA
ncbi:MAG TPA: DUF2169 domain-containing protein [Paucimonas sp.]|nr:DUF2169 domain-containing protein [Paucimonas sp.]